MLPQGDTATNPAPCEVMQRFYNNPAPISIENFEFGARRSSALPTEAQKESGFSRRRKVIRKQPNRQQ